jgi:hypothetical protein
MERVDPGLGDGGTSAGLDDKLGALKGCIKVTLGLLGNPAFASFSLDSEVCEGERSATYGVVIC